MYVPDSLRFFARADAPMRLHFGERSTAMVDLFKITSCIIPCHTIPKGRTAMCLSSVSILYLQQNLEGDRDDSGPHG